MGSFLSVCGKLVKGAELSYAAVSRVLPFLQLPDGSIPHSEGLLLVQVLRSRTTLSLTPNILIVDSETDTHVQLHNVAGANTDLPKNLPSDTLDVLSLTPESAAHSMHIVMLIKERDITHLELLIDFGTEHGSYRLPLNDSSIMVSSNSAEAFGCVGSTDPATYHQHTLNSKSDSDEDGASFSLSVIRYNVLPNQRYPVPFDKPGLQALIEGTRTSDFNPYPLPLNHISEGKRWMNWGQTLTSTPTRIYSDGAILPGENEPRYPSPRTIEDCQAIIAYANEHDLNVRVFGTNHSWSPLSSTSGVLVDNRQLNCVTPSPGFDPLNNGRLWPGYSMTLNPSDPDANGHASVRFPPGISTGDLERWIQVNGGYRMPTSTVEDVFTMGGILATGCHGTGKKNPTISDWVVAMEFIDHQGVLRRISKRECPDFYKQTVKLNEYDDSSPTVTLDHDDLFHAMLCNLGTFGIIWSYTMRIYEPQPVYLIAKTIPWKELFDDTDEARENLARLQTEYETFEVFYFPFRFTGKLFPVYEENPYIYVWLGGTKPPSDSDIEVYEPTAQELFGADLVQHMGVYMLSKWFASAVSNPMLAALMPYLASMMFFNLLLTVNPQGKSCAWKIPQWRASHPFNAIGSVESIPCVDIEWSMQMNLNQGGKGFTTPNRAFGDIIRAIHKAHRSSNDPFDMNRYPVTITAEMRILSGSSALMSPQYYPNFDYEVADGRAYCMPEIVSHAGNAGWNKFYEELNAEMISPANLDRYGPNVRCHQAKEFSIIPGQLRYLRECYRSEVYKQSNPFDYFLAIRRMIDPNNMFINPYLSQFLLTNIPTYLPPSDLPIFTRGQIHKLDERLKQEKIPEAQPVPYLMNSPRVMKSLVTPSSWASTPSASSSSSSSSSSTPAGWSSSSSPLGLAWNSPQPTPPPPQSASSVKLKQFSPGPLPPRAYETSQPSPLPAARPYALSI